MKAFCTEQLEPKSKHSPAVSLAAQGCREPDSQGNSTRWQRFETEVQDIKSQNSNLQDLQEYFLPCPSATAATQDHLLHFCSFKTFFSIKFIKATVFPAGADRPCCQVSLDALFALFSTWDLSDPTVYWSKNLDTRVKLLGGDCCCYSRSGSRCSHCELGQDTNPSL